MRLRSATSNSPFRSPSATSAAHPECALRPRATFIAPSWLAVSSTGRAPVRDRLCWLSDRGRLDRETDAQVHPRQDADLVRVRIAQRQSLADQRLDADAKLEPTVERLAPVAHDRRSKDGRARARHRQAVAAGRAVGPDERGPPAQLQRAAAEARQVGRQHRYGDDAGRCAAAATRAGSGRQRLIAEADANADVVEEELVVERVEEPGTASLDEQRVVGVALLRASRRGAQCSRYRRKCDPFHVAPPVCDPTTLRNQTGLESRTGVCAADAPEVDGAQVNSRAVTIYARTAGSTSAHNAALSA